VEEVEGGAIGQAVVGGAEPEESFVGVLEDVFGERDDAGYAHGAVSFFLGERLVAGLAVLEGSGGDDDVGELGGGEAAVAEEGEGGEREASFYDFGEVEVGGGGNAEEVVELGVGRHYASLDIMPH
jgi:hypothetical protein